jgi:hypothetical protein
MSYKNSLLFYPTQYVYCENTINQLTELLKECEPKE